MTATSGRQHRLRPARRHATSRCPGTKVLSVTDPTRRRQRPGHLPVPDRADFQPGAFDLTRHAGQPDRRPTSTSRSRSATWRRRSARVRRAAARRLRPRSRGDQHLDRSRVSRRATTRSPRPTRGASGSRRRDSRRRSGSIRPADVARCGPADRSINPRGTATLIVPAVARSARSAPAGCSRSRSPARTASAPTRRATSRQPAGDVHVRRLRRRGDTSPICSVEPRQRPEVMDTITPTDVSQDTELDPTLGPGGASGRGPVVPVSRTRGRVT